MLTKHENVLEHSFPSKLFLEATTRCNLRCPMCVKQSGGGIRSGDLSVAIFDRLKPALARLDEVIIGGIGEPLLHPLLEAFICDMKTALPASGSVGLQTNGTLLTDTRIESLLSVDVDTICISVDAATAKMLATIRTGARFDLLETALKRLNQTKHRASCSGPLVGIQCVVMRQNLSHLPQVIQWAGRLGVDFAIVSHLLPFDAAMAQQVVYPSCSDAAIYLFRKWRQDMRRSGLHIENYLAASMKFYKSRSDAENRLVAMVEAMKAESSCNDITLNLAKLMNPPDTWMASVHDVFEEALAIAQDLGLDLILPSCQPDHVRQCSFIEEGSVFVNWDGKVSPCQFVRHPYTCYPDGREKVVRPVYFGDLQSTPLQEIWDSADFRHFRKNVLQYDFPSCADCGFLPCDYIDGRTFEQDCHTNTIPCCDCPWSTGILNCLQ